MAIIMTDGAFPLSAIFSAETKTPSTARYWQPVDIGFISSYLNENVEIYEYDPDSEDEGTDLLESLDPDDELAWEIPPVQEWVKGRELNRGRVDQISHFLGFGSGFVAEEVIAGDVHRKLGEDEAPKPELTRSRPERPRCLWCQVPVDRRYNFNRNAVMEMGDFQDFESPVFWSDGVVTEKGAQAGRELSENHYGDCVISCSACGAMFLASKFESAYPRSYFYQDHASWSTNDQLVIEGSCEEGSNENRVEEATLGCSNLAGTFRFLKRAQANNLINWSEWTALQQVINWLADEDRQAKLEEKTFHFPEAEGIKNSIVLFLERTRQIKIGTLGGLSPFIEMHHEELQDENFPIHNQEVQEVLPMANMLRIAAQGMGGWATPSHPAILEPVLRSGWSEFDQYIALRGKAVLAARESGLTDWVVAVDMKGNLISWE